MDRDIDQESERDGLRYTETESGRDGDIQSQREREKWTET